MADLIGRSVTTRQGVITPPNQGGATLTLSGYSFSSYSAAALVYTLQDKYALFAYGLTEISPPSGAKLRLSGYEFYAYGGGTRLTAPLCLFTASGYTDLFAGVTLQLSGYTLNALGTTDAAGGVAHTYTGTYTFASLGGGNAAGTLPRTTVAASGTADKLGQVTGVLPRATLVASGYGDNLGQVVGVLPTLTIAPSGRIVATLPRAMFVATGGSQSVVYEAYSVTLEDGREGLETYTTHYTNYPFDRIVRFNGKYYGVAADGLYELSGNTFDGTEIVSVVQTAPTDFGQRTMKRPVSLYLSGRVGADFRVAVTTAEETTNRYTYKPVQITGSRTHRVLFGKGVRARYISYTLTNTDGGDFELDDMTPEVVVMERRTA
jgi:hypothetical protein